MKRSLAILFLLFLSANISAQTDLSYYFPDDPDLDPDIPTPAEVLGHEVGEKHVIHENLVRYLSLLAGASERMKIETYGYTYEGRPLVMLTVSDPSNLNRLAGIREAHLALSDPDVNPEVDMEEQPVVTWLGYSVHGNEASGINASLLVAYYLAASRSEETREILKNSIILIDPSINPDGYSRFEQWVNQFRSHVEITDPANLELNEPWPGGRTNHYWFDLNRDWLLLQHPESRARVAVFHQWKPNILTDHHEMGSNSTFFFQPGIPSRNNPNTPEETFLLTGRIAEFHAEALDKIGSLYYARESFDDFYYGKGSTYPDINGGVGILFEQASSRGHARETDNGVLTLPFAIRNQVTVSLSTLKAGHSLRNELLHHQREFYRKAVEEARENTIKAYVVNTQDDRLKQYHFLDLLIRHQIRIHDLNEDIQVSGKTYHAGEAFIIPTGQAQHGLIKAIFEKTTEFNDSLFYDVSTWTIPLAFDMPYDELPARDFSEGLLGDQVREAVLPSGNITGRSDYGYLFRWDQFAAPRALFSLQDQGLRVRLSHDDFTTADGQEFSRGSLFIPVQGQPLDEDVFFDLLSQTAKDTGIDFFPVETGYTASGINLGSPQIDPLRKPEIMLFVGNGISSYDAGEVWHLLDRRLEIPVSLVTIDVFNRISLEKYNTIIMVNGNYSGISDSGKEKLKNWLEAGGVLIGTEGASRWLSNQKLASIQFKSATTDTLRIRKYNDLGRDRGAQYISGAILSTSLDLTHPLCYGYPDNDLPVFKNTRYFFERPSNPYNHPVSLTNDPLRSGYISRENYEALSGTTPLVVSTIGRGRTICFSDDPNFRAFWFGTSRLFFNAIFFGNQISGASAR